MPTTIELPRILDLPGLDEGAQWRNDFDITGPWIVILYNCDCHTFADVAGIMVKAIRCTLDEGYAIAERVHTQGRTIVFSGTQEECDRVARIIASIRLQVETDRA